MSLSRVEENHTPYPDETEYHCTAKGHRGGLLINEIFPFIFCVHVWVRLGFEHIVDGAAVLCDPRKYVNIVTFLYEKRGSKLQGILDWAGHQLETTHLRICITDEVYSCVLRSALAKSSDEENIKARWG